MLLLSTCHLELVFHALELQELAPLRDPLVGLGRAVLVDEDVIGVLVLAVSRILC